MMTMANAPRALLLAGLVLATTVTSTAAHADFKPIDRVVAIVENDVILQSELDQRLAEVQQKADSQRGPLPPANELRKQLLDHLILESIQLQMGDHAGVRISDAQLNDAISNIAAKNGIADLEQFKAALEAQGLSYEEMREQVRREMTIQRVQQGNLNSRVQVTEQEVENFLQSPEGAAMTAGQFRLAHLLYPLDSDASNADATRAEQTMAALGAAISSGKTSFEQVLKDKQFEGAQIEGGDLGLRKQEELPAAFAQVAPTLGKGQVSAPFRSGAGIHLLKVLDRKGGGGQIVAQTHARHILIKPSAIRSDDQARDFVAQLRARILKGDDFGALAKQYSDDIGSAMQGGDLDWANPGQFVPAFETAMGALPINGISEPFKSPFGWHVLQVLERRNQDMSQIRWQNQAHQMLYQRKFDDELQAWLQKIRDESFVELK
jgi:peptidyl-prolyl cis-trans isomerase SurA